MVTVVITSCGRIDLLQRTTESFLRFNTYPISNYIIVDDSGDEKIYDEIKHLYPNWELVLEPENRGQVRCIDDGYSRVKTPYIFHCEDDWEFIKSGFIEKSLTILEKELSIMQVWLLTGNRHPIEPLVFEINNVQYRLLGWLDDIWYGFTWNPGLRRLSDYKLVAPFSQFIEIGDFNALTECRIGQKYTDLGYRAAVLNDEYCFHIG